MLDFPRSGHIIISYVCEKNCLFIYMYVHVVCKYRAVYRPELKCCIALIFQYFTLMWCK